MARRESRPGPTSSNKQNNKNKAPVGATRGSHNRHGGASRNAGGKSQHSTASHYSGSQSLSADSLAKLNAEYEKVDKKRTVRTSGDVAPMVEKEKYIKRKRRVVSGPALEDGRRGARREKDEDEDGLSKGWTTRKRIWIAVALLILLLVILVPVGVLVIGKNNGGGNNNAAGAKGSSSSTATPSNPNLRGVSQSDIPTSAKGTILDPFSWYDTTDFNVTYTDVKVGGLPIMGLNSTWDDGARANDKVPALNQAWEYGKMPIRGVNVGGWLSLEPFITPSLFEPYDSKMNVVDEYTLTQHLGSTPAAQTLEKHYATFVTEQTFVDIAAAGLDHVRIPFPYWAVVTYPGDPYVPQIAWRYLLRGIEWARKHGLRVNLDLHSVPGSQNGWNHSGRQGEVGWINGTDGPVNAQRSLDIHNQLSTFFAQPRYKDIIVIYGLLNEPKMTSLPVDAVQQWTANAVQIVQKNGITARIAVADGFLGLPEWKGKLTAYSNLVLDAHQYIIFNNDQLAFPHDKKLGYACSGFGTQIQQSNDPTTGFGPTICGEWSQADTDCAPYLNNVNVGARWTGTLNTADPSAQVLQPVCPAAPKCSCDSANADPGQYTDAYKKWLRVFADAQMQSFEKGWGWFYWNWDTEKATLWSWKKGRDAGILPTSVAGTGGGRAFDCGSLDAGTSAAQGFDGLDESY